MSKSSSPDSAPSAKTASGKAPAGKEGERIAKRLARAGLCSRRDAERWVEEGRVALNGTVLTSPAINVAPGDRVTVDGQDLPADEPTRVWRYHKPAGLVTTARDEMGRATVFDHLPEDMPRVISIGRLDLNTEGLLLLTNDGELARHLELPATGWPRRYRVRVHGQPDTARLAALADGIFVDGIEYGPIEAVVDREQGANAWLTLTLREGKNREIRKVLEHLGLTVNRLIRLAYGPFQLGTLERGGVEEVPRRILRDQLPGFFPKGETNRAATTRIAAEAAKALRFDTLPKSKGGPQALGFKAAGGKPDGADRTAAPVPRARRAEMTSQAPGEISRPGKPGPARSGGHTGVKPPSGKPVLGKPGTRRPRAADPDVVPNRGPDRGPRSIPGMAPTAQEQARALARAMDRALARTGPDDDEDDDAPHAKKATRRPSPRTAAAPPVAGARPGARKPNTGHPGTGQPNADRPSAGQPSANRMTTARADAAPGKPTRPGSRPGGKPEGGGRPTGGRPAGRPGAPRGAGMGAASGPDGKPPRKPGTGKGRK